MKKLFVAALAVMFVLPAVADEGMWLLPYLNKLNIKDMKAKGLKLDAEDIYNVNGSSLKDAIVIFGGGCTGEVVSAEGLLLTNHHCGYPNIQSVSTVEHDYLNDGFWAMSREEEIPAPGLAVTFVRRMDDVTAEVLGEAAGMGVGAERDEIVKANLARVTEERKAANPEYNVEIRSFMGGNQYFALVTEVFRDVRLVGTPPNSMGKFGGDTDNWMWPRHTDDFSMFRIYAGADNKPAEYSPENKPYQASRHLEISIKGIKENDFSMVMGFPGSTNRYMTTSQMEHMIDVENTNRIYIRGERQAIIMEDMLADPAVRLKYASKYAQSANYWKNSIGMNKALADNNIPERKAELEARFQAWADGVESEQQYKLALPSIKAAVEASSKADGIVQYLYEALWAGSEIVSSPARIMNAMKMGEDGAIANIDEVKAAAAKFYNDYNEPTDRRVAKRMFTIVRENLEAENLPSLYADIDSLFGGNVEAWVDNMFDNSVFASQEKLFASLDDYSQEVFVSDPAVQAMMSVQQSVMGLSMGAMAHAKAIEDWHRVYIKGLGEMDPAAKLYPDANFSLRLTYGQVLPYSPRDGVDYRYYTTLAGVIEKEDPSNALEFTVEQKIKDAYAASDYGIYGQDGELRINFLSNNDITGGNSGSPVLNAHGQLIGLAFDGNWEAMSGDVVFEPELQRCINLDIRYVLWTIDNFAGAGYLLDEMTIVKK
ncbi:MAG: S46 family peptidase [Alistipes sp.]|jgi:hypothetical protein|nr:S46 family peptidase [Alistipes sp.]